MTGRVRPAGDGADGPREAPRGAAWTWRLEDLAGQDLARRGSVAEPPAFARRFDAEVWLGARWRELAREGVARAVLRRGADDVGAPLALRDVSR